MRLWGLRELQPRPWQKLLSFAPSSFPYFTALEEKHHMQISEVVDGVKAEEAQRVFSAFLTPKGIAEPCSA